MTDNDELLRKYLIGSDEDRKKILENYSILNQGEMLNNYLDLKEANLPVYQDSPSSYRVNVEVEQGTSKFKEKISNPVSHVGGENIDYGIGMLGNSTVIKDTSTYGYLGESDVNVVDSDWATSKFLVPWDNLKERDRDRSVYTWARTKTSDSSLGNHSVINPLPQFTRYADPRVTTRLDKKDILNAGTRYFATGLGMGRYYSEALDDYQQEIYIQFGTPEFNSMLSFLTNAVTYEDAYIANHGRYPYGYGIGSIIGSRLIFGVYPWLSLAIWAIKTVVKMFMGFSPFSYYYLNPNMHMYWGSVNTIVSSMAVELGIYSPDYVQEFLNGSGDGEVDKVMQNETSKRMGVPVKLDYEEMQQLSDLLPGLFNPKTGYIDMYKIATTHQSIATEQKRYIEKLLAGDIKSPEEPLVENPESDNPKLTDAGRKLLGDFTAYLVCDDFTTSTRDVSEMIKMDISKKNDNPFIQWQKQRWTLVDGAQGFNSAVDALKSDWNTFATYLKWVLLGDEETKFGKIDQDVKDKKPPITNTGYLQVEGQKESAAAAEQRQQAEDAKKVASGGQASKRADTQKQETFKDNVVQTVSLTRSSASNLPADNNGSTNDPTTVGKSGNALDNELTSAPGNPGEKPAGNIFTFGKVFNAAENWLENAARVTDAVQKDGGLFLGLRVNSTRSLSDSFSNSTGPIQTGEMIKSVAGTARNVNFMLSGGNIIPGMSDLLGAAKNVALGILDGASFGLSSVVASALEGAFVDIPDKWEDSKCSLNNVSYSVRLVAPYGNPISQLQNIYIPLACLLAGILPLGTGRSSHTSPYICSVFSKGVQNIELGIMTELSIERGTSNLPFSKWKQPLAIDVNFTITDLSGIITTPINRSVITAFLQGGPSEVVGQLTTESKLDDYIGTLCARDLSNSRFIMPQFKRRLKKALMRGSQAINPNSMAMLIGEATNMFAGFLGAADGYTQFKTNSTNPMGTK